MIGRLRGTVVAQRADRVIVEVGGVGYDVAMPTRAIAELPPSGSEVVVHTHLHVREDTLSLFGFLAESELNTFRILLMAPGIGPKVALAVLSTLDADAVAVAIAEEDIATLSLVPGIGKRTAQKLVMELKPRFSAVPVSGGGASSDVRLALGELGYTDAEVAEALAGADTTASSEEQLRAALRTLAARR